jgi:ribokinase
MTRARLLVIGSTNTDMVVRSPSIPTVGETVLGGDFHMFPGGKGANQAVAAARAGAEVAFITAIGNDQFGTASLERFKAEEIGIQGVVTKPGVPSGIALIVVDDAGENVIVVAPGANAMLTSEDLLSFRPLFSNADMVVIQLEIPIATVYRAVHLAKEAGCRILLNPAPMPPEGLHDDLLRDIDYLTPNETEVLQLAPEGKTAIEAAQRVLARGPKAVIVTRGSRGVTVCTADGVTEVPAHPVKAVDTVGAGDCFSASLGVALAEKRDLRSAVQFAVVAAGLSTTIPGAQEGMPKHTDIEKALHTADGL